MRRLLAILAILATASAFGCGARYELPTESKGAEPIPADGSYGMLATWKGLDGIRDVLLTQGPGSQLFLLFNTGGSGGPATPRGSVQLYTFTRPQPIGPPYFTPPTGLFNPVALAATTDWLFVLDQGDTCLARYNGATGSCAADPGHNNPIRDFNAYWRLREYSIVGGDTVSTFTDTTLAMVFGVAADNAGHVYISGVAAVLDTSPTNPNIRTRKFVSRIYRYARGVRYPGLPDSLARDRNMPGSNWHRDTSWVVFDGTGTSSVSDPLGIVWTSAGSPALFVADAGNNKAKLMSSLSIGVGYLAIDGNETGANFDHPSDVAVDLKGFLYVVDQPNRRVLRYTPSGEYERLINLEPNSDGLPLLDPVSVGVDDSVAYIADRGRGEVIRYKRRP
jgi:hypothetical protein